MKSYIIKSKDWLNKNRIEILASVVVALAAMFLASTFLAVRAENSAANPWNVIRLHILAADDTYEEQQLKLAVRDEVWSFVEEILLEVDDKTKAKEIIGRNLAGIEQKARGVLYDNDSEHDVYARLVQDLPFPPMLYAGTFFLPRGPYDALQIIIGDGIGENWWCIMFPPMCLMDIALGEALSTDNPNELVLRPRLRIFEWFRR